MYVLPARVCVCVCVCVYIIYINNVINQVKTIFLILFAIQCKRIGCISSIHHLNWCCLPYRKFPYFKCLFNSFNMDAVWELFNILCGAFNKPRSHIFRSLHIFYSPHKSPMEYLQMCSLKPQFVYFVRKTRSFFLLLLRSFWSLLSFTHRALFPIAVQSCWPLPLFFPFRMFVQLPLSRSQASFICLCEQHTNKCYATTIMYDIVVHYGFSGLFVSHRNDPNVLFWHHHPTNKQMLYYDTRTPSSVGPYTLSGCRFCLPLLLSVCYNNII